VIADSLRAKTVEHERRARQRSASGAHSCSLFNLDELTGLDIVQVAVEGDRGGNQWVISDALDIVDDGPLLVGDGEEIGELRCAGAGAFAHILETFSRESCRFKGAGKQTTDDIVGEELHAAVGVMDNEEFLSAEKLVADDERTDGVVGGSAAGVANDVCVAFGG